MLKSNEVALVQPRVKKSTELTTKLLHTIMFVQNIEHSYIVASRK